MSNSEFIIGPLKYQHSVQKITIQERKAIEAVEVTRSSKNFIVDSGDSEHKAQIRLLFTGLDEINGGVGDDTVQSGLRGLIALFKACPIISIKNKYLTASWKDREDTVQKTKYKRTREFIEKTDRVNKAKTDLSNVINNAVGYTNYILDAVNKKFDKNYKIDTPSFLKVAQPSFDTPISTILAFNKSSKSVFSDSVPIALESLELENVPDIPNSIQATINIARVDIGAYTENGTLEYVGQKGPFDKSSDPLDAYWLKVWINKILDSGIIPELRPEDFISGTVSWYGENSLGNILEDEVERFQLDLTTNSNSEAILLSENCSLRHKFGYNKIIGKLYPSVCHMGTTSRFMSLDIIFNNQRSVDTYEKFCNFKHASDSIAKSKNRLDRVSGWHIRTPISKLLGINKTVLNSLPSDYPWEGVFVPIFVNSENGSEPDMINTRVDLIESNIDFFKENEITLASSGTDYDDLKNYFDKLAQREQIFRSKLLFNRPGALDEITGNSESSNYPAYVAFWPIEKSIIYVKEESRFGILNADTLRATVMSSYMDPARTIQAALLKCTLATGEIVANRRITFFDKLVENGKLLKATFFGASLEDQEIKRVYEAVKGVIQNNFIADLNGANAALPDIDELATQLTLGYLGDRTEGLLFSSSISGTIIKQLAGSSARLSPKFLDALFKVIIERRPKLKELPYVYSTDGVYSAFYKLITGYTLDRDALEGTIQDAADDIKESNANRDSLSLYPDLILPTYEELYGAERWEEFAPNAEDIGASAYLTIDGNSVPIVSRNDYVSPAAWFYIARAKTGNIGLKALAKSAIEAVDNNSPLFSLSVPFNTEDIEELKQQIKIKYDGAVGSQLSIANNTISEIIKNAFVRHKNSNPTGFREDIVNISQQYPDLTSNTPAADRFSKKYNQGNGSIKLYIHHNGNKALPREVTIPGLGAEIYRVLSESKDLLINDTKRRLDADAEYVTPLQKEIRYKRHLKDATSKTILSNIDQLPDDQYSPERMFPSMRVYLLERRGSDLIADDTLFSLASVISIDITMDKDDAPLAVVKLADPLYSLQNDYFTSKNVIYSKEDKPEKVLGSLKSLDIDSYAKRYKLVQGRPVQIRMGYGSMSKNLPIVFTGRITEIVPGDQLTIVCQGWKAELINRQVSFYNDDPKNWGARDLAIQALLYATPEGFGDFYPQFDINFILKHLSKEDVSLAMEQSFNNGQNIDLDTSGHRTILNSTANWFTRSIGLSSIDKDDKGLDTRLKNIWYPDTKPYNNLFGLRSKFGVMPSWHNDSWIVPIQPSWDVLKEAARHAWNCIVDVVPYDGEATLFMGHPDQPYFFTRGIKSVNKAYSKYRKTVVKNTQEVLDTLVNGFFESKYYANDSGTFYYTANEEIIKTYKDFAAVPDLLSFYNIYTGGNSVQFVGAESLAIKEFRESIEISTLPITKLTEVKDRVGSGLILTNLFCDFFGLDKEKIKFTWGSSEQDIEELFSRNSKTELLNPEILQKVDSHNGAVPYNKDLAEFIKNTILTNSIDDTESAKKFYFNRNNYSSLISRFTNTNLTNETIIKIRQIQERSKAPTSFIVEEHKDKLPSFKPGQYKDTSQALAAEGVYLYNMYSNLYNSIQDKTDTSIRRSILTRLGGDISKNLPTLVKDNFALFKAFVYYFSCYVLETPEAQTEAAKLKEEDGVRLPPNMRVFRTIHFADSTHNIIKNLIVATTREMWNTVVIEHPSPGEAESQITNRDELFSKGRFNSGINWVYYPSQEVTGVIGLQFHPGLTLSNKKVQVFTELNCQSKDLAAKLACTRLAEGIKKMYRGSLLMLGKNIKPHDRIILADEYTKMSGPVEVESVVHHWNAEQGWITNITPCAVCDANPGASVLQVAAMEATFQAVYNGLEFISDAMTYALIIATLGAATPLAIGEFSISRGVLGLATRLKNKGFIGAGKETIKKYAQSLGQLRNAGSDLANIFKRGHQFDFIKRIIKDYGGPAKSYLLNQFLVGSAEYVNHLFYKGTVIPAFIEGANDVEQLPVILSPLIFNNTAFTAGLETEDSVWSVAAFGLYYSMKEMQAGASRLMKDFFGE